MEDCRSGGGEVEEPTLLSGDAGRMAEPIIQLHDFGNERADRSLALPWTAREDTSWVELPGSIAGRMRN